MIYQQGKDDAALAIGCVKTFYYTSCRKQSCMTWLNDISKVYQSIKSVEVIRGWI